MIADQNFYDICFTFFYPMASATAERSATAKHSATAEGENCAYGPTLVGAFWAHYVEPYLRKLDLQRKKNLHLQDR